MAAVENPVLTMSNVIHQWSLLEATLGIDYQGVNVNQQKRFRSPEYIIQGISLIQIQVDVKKQYYRSCNNQYQYTYIFFLNVAKIEKLGSLKTRINFSCKDLGIENKSIMCEDGLHQIYEQKTMSPGSTFDVTLKMEIIDASGTFESLYDDSDLIDFELHGEGGTVPVHKAVLAANSPVFKRMLVGEWKENKLGNVNIPGTSKNTLESFKTYMYLHTMPQSGFQQLLLLAAYYMMPVLEQRCIEQLVNRMTSQNVLNLCEFAVKNQMTNLHLAVLDYIGSGTIKVSDIRFAVMKNASK